MEGDGPRTPVQVRSGRSSKSPNRLPVSSSDSDSVPSNGRLSPDTRCVICLGKLQKKSFTDSCLHQFCFHCLVQWSKVKPECPLCKQPFKSIIYNVRSNCDYDQYHIQRRDPTYVVSGILRSYDFNFVPVDRRFRYRSTMTRQYFGELAQSFLARARSAYRVANFIPPISYHIPPSGRYTPPERRSVRGGSDFRRRIYEQDLWVRDLTDVTGRYRECTPQFYRENPAQIHRIIPWLNREINSLLNDYESYTSYVLDRIVSLLPQYSIKSREFREAIEPYFGSRTDHFIHEFYIFARSVYDITGFDQNAMYVVNPNNATEVQQISSSSSDDDNDNDNDDDHDDGNGNDNENGSDNGSENGDDNGSDNDDDNEIEVLSTSDDKGPSSSICGRYRNSASSPMEGIVDSTEPVAGPSGINTRRITETIDVCDSDADDIKIIEYIKPEPELVVVSSGEDDTCVSIVESSSRALCSGSWNESSNDSLEMFVKESKSDVNRAKKRKITSKKGKSDGTRLKGCQKKSMKMRKRRNSSSSNCSENSLTLLLKSFSCSSDSNDSDEVQAVQEGSSSSDYFELVSKVKRKKLSKDLCEDDQKSELEGPVKDDMIEEHACSGSSNETSKKDESSIAGPSSTKNHGSDEASWNNAKKMDDFTYEDIQRRAREPPMASYLSLLLNNDSEKRMENKGYKFMKTGKYNHNGSKNDDGSDRKRRANSSYPNDGFLSMFAQPSANVANAPMPKYPKRNESTSVKSENSVVVIRASRMNVNNKVDVQGRRPQDRDAVPASDPDPDSTMLGPGDSHDESH